MNTHEAEQSYRNDPTFRFAVDSLAKWIIDAHVTPAEVRAAAMLACIHVENITLRRYYVGDTDAKRLDRSIE